MSLFSRFLERRARRRLAEGLELYRANEPGANPALSVECLDECKAMDTHAEFRLELLAGSFALDVDGTSFALRRAGELLASSASFSSLDVSYRDGRVIGIVECHGRAAA